MLDECTRCSPRVATTMPIVMAGVPNDSQLVAASRAGNRTCHGLRASADAVEFGAEISRSTRAGAHQIFSELQVQLAPELRQP